jgi:hypothetical protein
VYDSIVNQAPQNTKLLRAVNVPNLIFWNDKNFIPLRCGQAPSGPPKQGCKTSFALKQLTSISTSQARELEAHIQGCKANFDHGFYFMYAVKLQAMTTVQMEHAVKNALKSICVFTTAKAQGSFPAVTIQLPLKTSMVHDLWSPPGVRTI